MSATNDGSPSNAPLCDIPPLPPGIETPLLGIRCRACANTVMVTVQTPGATEFSMDYRGDLDALEEVRKRKWDTLRLPGESRDTWLCPAHVHEVTSKWKT